jgi:HEAT repeat protein
MRPKIILCLALVLSGGLLGFSQNYHANEAERVENNREIVRLAILIDSNKPPVTGEMLETGEFDGSLFDLGLSSGKFTSYMGTTPGNTQAILIRLLNYSLPPAMSQGFSIIGEDWIRENAADILVAVPSPAVVPVLREWLEQGLAAAEAGKFCRWGEVAEAAKGLGRFHDTTIVPLLVAAWQDGVFEKKIDTMFLGDIGARHVRETVVLTLAEMPSPIAKNILLEAMQDKCFDESIRYPIAAALVRLDDQSAREFLLDGLDRYLAPDQDTLESSRDVFAKYELEKLGDAKLISAIEAKVTVATRKRPKLVMAHLVERMRVNNLPMKELKQIALDEKDLNRRLPAIETLGETGKPDVLPFLESLISAPPDYLGKSQKDLFAGVVRGAIRNINLHNWQQPENKP